MVLRKSQTERCLYSDCCQPGTERKGSEEKLYRKDVEVFFFFIGIEELYVLIVLNHADLVSNSVIIKEGGVHCIVKL